MSQIASAHLSAKDWGETKRAAQECLNVHPDGEVSRRQRTKAPLFLFLKSSGSHADRGPCCCTYTTSKNVEEEAPAAHIPLVAVCLR